MEFFYPNFQNDMWRIMGLIFYLDKEHFIVKAEKRFDKEKVEQFCTAEVLCELFACKMPKMGESCTVNYQQKTLQFYRMPSSSRAYPLQLEKKAEMYRKLFEPYA